MKRIDAQTLCPEGHILSFFVVLPNFDGQNSNKELDCSKSEANSHKTLK